MKINNFQGDLTDISARKESLLLTKIQQLKYSRLLRATACPDDVTFQRYVSLAESTAPTHKQVRLLQQQQQ